MNTDEQARTKCVTEIATLLNFLEAAEQFALFCSHNQDRIKKEWVSEMRKRDAASALPGRRTDNVEYTIDKFTDSVDLFIDDLQKIKQVTEIIKQLKREMKEKQIPLSQKFYSFLNIKFFRSHIEQAPLLTKNLLEFLRDQADVDISDQAFKFRVCFVEIPIRIHAILESVNLLKIFNEFKEINKNIVLIGPNGCGKSTFSRAVANQLELNAIVIPAQKLFSYNEKYPINPESSREEINKQQKQDKLGRDMRRDIPQYTSDFDAIIRHLATDHMQHSNREHEKRRTKRTATLLDNAIKIWKEMITLRKLKLNSKTFALYVSGKKIKKYPLMELSDGEKAILYYIAHTMLAEENAYIIVDEPENHLNLAVVNRLWDRLEQKRKDCQFIYLTHNPDFAVGRRNADILWVTNMSPHSTEGLKYKKIENRDDIDKRLMIELIGSETNILFCEGKKDGLDYKTYSLLFPEYTVTPVDGCGNVIRYTQVYNGRSKFFSNSAIGIVDGDFRTQERVDSLKHKYAVYCLSVPDIENLLHDEMLLKVGAKELKSPNLTATEDVKTEVLYLLRKNKKEQASLCITRKISTDIKKELPTEGRDMEEFLLAYSNLTNENFDTYRKQYHARIKEIEKAIKDENYNQALTFYGCKSIRSAGNKIVDDYTYRIIEVLRDDKKLCAKLRNKYFPEINEKETNNSMPVAVSTTMPPKEPHDI